MTCVFEVGGSGSGCFSGHSPPFGGSGCRERTVPRAGGRGNRQTPLFGGSRRALRDAARAGDDSPFGRGGGRISLRPRLCGTCMVRVQGRRTGVRLLARMRAGGLPLGSRRRRAGLPAAGRQSGSLRARASLPARASGPRAGPKAWFPVPGSRFLIPGS